MLALRSNLEEPGEAVQIAGKAGSSRFWKGDGKNRAGGAQCNGRAGRYEELVPNAGARDTAAKFMKVKLSSPKERQNWVCQGTGGQLGDLSRGEG